MGGGFNNNAKNPMMNNQGYVNVAQNDTEWVISVYDTVFKIFL